MPRPEVHFSENLAKPPAGRVRNRLPYPRVAQSKHIPDRASRDLHWKLKTLSAAGSEVGPETDANTSPALTQVSDPKHPMSCERSPLGFPLNFVKRTSLLCAPPMLSSSRTPTDVSSNYSYSSSSTSSSGSEN